MSEHPISGLMDTTMAKLRDLVDVNTIIGQPITTANGITIIPISKVTFGFASGGADIPSSKPKETFGGGSGAGVTIHPLGFLVINGDNVKIVQMSNNDSTPDKLVGLVPEMFDKVTGFIAKNKEEKKAKEDE